jgi:hypothetical protein
MTTSTRLDVFLHRAQQWATVSMLVALNELYEHGVRAFEVDVTCNVDGRVVFGHPARPDKWYEEPSHEVSRWAIHHGVTILLDLKQSVSWNPSIPAIARFFEALLPTHFLVASRDLESVTRVGEHFGFSVCNIITDPQVYVPDDVIFIVPASVAMQLPADRHDGRVIVSGIQSALEISSLMSIGLSRFMTDKLEIATMPLTVFEQSAGGSSYV